MTASRLIPTSLLISTNQIPSQKPEEGGGIKTNKTSSQHGVRRCVETIILVLLPVSPCHGIVHAGTLGANCLQYPFQKMCVCFVWWNIPLKLPALTQLASSRVSSLCNKLVKLQSFICIIDTWQLVSICILGHALSYIMPVIYTFHTVTWHHSKCHAPAFLSRLISSTNSEAVRVVTQCVCLNISSRCS